MGQGNIITFKDALELFFKKYSSNKQLVQVRIKRLWEEEMGEFIMNETEAISFNNGKLFIKLKNSMLRNELSYSKTVIINNLNKKLGEDIIKEIILF
ncbi:MAG: hypothetical protein A2X12_04555 [Bacteroidetes bacterium GWE2_29_8]|nr:MAG: hypothetical protein A2X12_04555 [Bacteroidetes bacterium GWE2_29_8]OFY14445.1 MAG: hypothetical protein A2X02_01445 [Bacteroidetes bacterium GWF2_29_10]